MPVPWLLKVCWQPLSFLGLQKPHSDLSFHLHMIFSLCVAAFKFLLFLSTVVLDQGHSDSTMTSFELITSAMTVFPSRVHSEVLETGASTYEFGGHNSTSAQPYKACTVVLSNNQMRKLKQREVQLLVRSYQEKVAELGFLKSQLSARVYILFFQFIFTLMCFRIYFINVSYFASIFKYKFVLCEANFST